MRLSGLLCLLLAGTIAVAQEIPGQSSGSYRSGDFVWYDLVTDDPVAAKRFYARMFGWSFSRDRNGYSIIRSDGEYLGGIFANEELDPSANDARWIPSVSVTDVDTAAAKASALGGTVLVEPENMQGRGRTAVIEDPQGAIVALLRSEQGDPAEQTVVSGDWLYLQHWTPDVDASAAFYNQLLDYTRRGNLLRHGASNRALLVEIDLENTGANWVPMVLVPDIGEGVSRVRALGGFVHIEPDEQFGDGRMALVADPTGGAFLLQGVQ